MDRLVQRRVFISPGCSLLEGSSDFEHGIISKTAPYYLETDR